MRSWIVEVTAFGVVVRMEQVFIHSPLGHLTNLEAERLLGFPLAFTRFATLLRHHRKLEQYSALQRRNTILVR
jgi:hypothetical protein